MSEAEIAASNAVEKAALEAAFAEAMKGQCQAAVPAPPIPIPEPNGAFQQTGPAGQAQGQERRGRVFSFTGGGLGSAQFSPQVSQGDDASGEVSPAFGRSRAAPASALPLHAAASTQSSRCFSRGVSGGSVSGLEERLQHMEEFLARSHEAQMRKQQEMEVKISERCGYVMQEVLESMMPLMVERLLDRMAQSMDFSELRDQLIDAFSASTEMIPMVEERSELMLALLQEDRVVKNRMVQEFTRVATSVDSFAASSSWQVPFMERLDALQRTVESVGMAVQRSAVANADASWASAMSSNASAMRPEDMTRKLPQGQAGQAKEKPPRTPSGEVFQGSMGAQGTQGLPAALREQRSRPPSGHSDRAPPRLSGPGRAPVNGRGNDPSWYTSPVARPVSAASPTAEGSPGAASCNGKAQRAPSSTSPSDSPVSWTAVASASGRAPSPGRDWPWQPKAPVVEEVQPEITRPVPTTIPMPTQRSRPSDFFSTRRSGDTAESKG